MESHTLLPPAPAAMTRGLRVLLYSARCLTCALLVFLIGYIFYRGVPQSSAGSCCPRQTSYIKDTIGILPNILNTLYIILLAMVIVLPLGVGAAIYLTEYATNQQAGGCHRVRHRDPDRHPLHHLRPGGYAVLHADAWACKTGVLAGGLTLVVMILPTIIRTTQESLKTVPQSYREGALALGAGKWHMVRTVVLPNAVDGIVTGCILAVGRIVGESAALLFTAGIRPGAATTSVDCPASPPPATLTVALYVLRQRAGRDRRGLRHCRHSDAADAVSSTCPPMLRGPETEESN